MQRDLTIKATDGTPLAATLWEPSDFSHAVVIGPAMGVRRQFYHDFARFLAGNNMAVVTMDYRGIGESLSEPLDEMEADAVTWAKSDLGGTIRWLTRTYPNSSVSAVCHSLSGQTLGLVEEATLLEKIVTVSTASGYWNLYPFPENLFFGFIWGGVYRGLTKLLGYFPGEVLGLGEDLPKNVALQVSGWGLSADYIGDFSSYKNITAPILSYSFTDDWYCRKACIDWIHKKYINAEIIRRHVRPHETRAEKIGHFGFFKKNRVPGLWREVVDWLTDHP